MAGNSSCGRLTTKSLLARIKKILKTKPVTIELKYIQNFRMEAYITWSTGGPIRVTIDPNKDGIVKGVIHELLHIVLEGHLKNFSSELEEVAIKAYENFLYNKISVDEPLMDEWVSLIHSKVARLEQKDHKDHE